jgi:hypothetical protein
MFHAATPSEPATVAFAGARDETSTAAHHRTILQRRIDEGARRASEVIAAIQRDQPRDQIIRMRAVRFATARSAGIQVHVGDDAYTPTDFAVGQIAGRAGVPLTYLRELVAPSASPWKHDLAVEILTRHCANSEDGRILVRSVRGQLRGWLSDRYRRLDARPLVDALAAEAAALGAVPVDGTVTDTRVALKDEAVANEGRQEFIADDAWQESITTDVEDLKKRPARTWVTSGIIWAQALNGQGVPRDSDYKRIKRIMDELGIPRTKRTGVPGW